MDDTSSALDRVRTAALNDWDFDFRRCATCDSDLVVVVSTEDDSAKSSAIRVRGMCPTCPRPSLPPQEDHALDAGAN